MAQSPVVNPEVCEAIVAGIRAHDPEAVQRLYEICSKGVRLILSRHLNKTDVDDKVHDIFILMVNAVRSDALCDPRCLAKYLHTLVRNQIARYVTREIPKRTSTIDDSELHEFADRSAMSAEEAMIRRERVAIVLRMLRASSVRNREVMIRFYVREQSPEDICRAMKLTPGQFRQIKHRTITKAVRTLDNVTQIRRPTKADSVPRMTIARLPRTATNELCA